MDDRSAGIGDGRMESKADLSCTKQIGGERQGGEKVWVVVGCRNRRIGLVMN